jgi:hypothetical protein
MAAVGEHDRLADGRSGRGGRGCSRGRLSPSCPTGSSEPPHPPTAAAMSRISIATPSRRTRWEILDVSRRAPAGNPLLPPPFQAMPCPVASQVETAAFLSRHVLAQQHCFETTSRRHRRRTDGRQTPDGVASRVIRAARLSGCQSPSRARWRRRRLIDEGPALGRTTQNSLPSGSARTVQDSAPVCPKTPLPPV